jgi:hypothetical protein
MASFKSRPSLFKGANASNWSIRTILIERCRQVCSTPSYSGRVGSNPGQENGYPDSGSRGFNQSFQENAGIDLKLGYGPFLPYPFQFTSVNLSFDAIQSALVTASLINPFRTNPEYTRVYRACLPGHLPIYPFPVLFFLHINAEYTRFTCSLIF